MARKRGKKVTWVDDSDGEDVVGLRSANKKDRAGRSYRQYYTIHDGKFVYFGKDDKSEAIKQFRRWQQKQINEGKMVIVENGHEFPCGYVEKIEHHLSEDAYIAKLVEDLATRPKWLAQRTGIEELGYLDKLDRPEPSITLKALADLYFSRPDAPEKDKNKTTNQKYFAEFIRYTKAKTVADLTGDAIGHYGDTITRQWKDTPPANIRNRYSIVRRILNYGLERGKDTNRLPQILILCQMLRMPKQSEPDPQPIEIKDFHKLLKGADLKWKAIYLLALNMALKPEALVQVKKEDVDLKEGIFSNLRPKTKQKRVGILWKRTIKAIKAYQSEHPHTSEFLFVNNDGVPFPEGRSLTKTFRSLRKKAGVEAGVKFEHIRDGSYSFGDDGTDVIKLVAGQSTGIKERYRKKLAHKTDKVIRMIETHYFSG